MLPEQRTEVDKAWAETAPVRKPSPEIVAAGRSLCKAEIALEGALEALQAAAVLIEGLL